MLLCATAAFMNRRSRMAQLMAAVPTAAQAAWRMKERRSSSEDDFFSIMLSLNDEIRGSEDQVGNRSHAIPHLGIGRSRVGKRGGVADDPGLGRGTQLAAAEERVQRVNETGDSGVGGIGGRHPGAQIKGDGAAAIVEAADAVRVVAVAEQPPFQEIHL